MANSKVTLAATLLVALVALATATRYTTIITTTTTVDDDDEETNPGQQQYCQRQLQSRQFRSCQRYLQSRQGPYMEDETAVLEMTTDDTNPGQQQQYSVQQCCNELRNVNEQCRCEAIRQVVRQSKQGGGGSYQGGQSQQVLYQKAMNLPRECGFRQQRCQIRAVSP